MTCSPIKCKELTLKRVRTQMLSIRLLQIYHNKLQILGVKQCKELLILGVSFQEDSRFVDHVKGKLTKANKGLFVLRFLRKEGYSQLEIEHLFNAIVLPNLVYGLSEYGASEADFSTVQYFIDRLMLQT